VPTDIEKYIAAKFLSHFFSQINNLLVKGLAATGKIPKPCLSTIVLKFVIFL